MPVVTVLLLAGTALARGEVNGPERVTFPSADGRTTLVGYLFLPNRPEPGRHPGVVMMHGRAGAYSTNAHGSYDASTLSKRHKAWGELWAQRGYTALLVDGFGPRGFPEGFPRFSYQTRPAELDEVSVRPLDAYGALAYLRSRKDVAGDRIGLFGWSNGGSATLASMSADPPVPAVATFKGGFRAALVFYAGCKLKGRFDQGGYRPYSPVLLLHGTSDEEVSYRDCVALVERSRERGGDIDIRLYRGATHGFDSPTSNRQSLEANAEATRDATAVSLSFFARQLGQGSD